MLFSFFTASSNFFNLFPLSADAKKAASKLPAATPACSAHQANIQKLLVSLNAKCVPKAPTVTHLEQPQLLSANDVPKGNTLTFLVLLRAQDVRNALLDRFLQPQYMVLKNAKTAHVGTTPMQLGRLNAMHVPLADTTRTTKSLQKIMSHVTNVQMIFP